MDGKTPHWPVGGRGWSPQPGAHRMLGYIEQKNTGTQESQESQEDAQVVGHLPRHSNQDPATKWDQTSTK